MKTSTLDITRHLTCDLTDQEVDNLSAELSCKVLDLEELKEEAKKNAGDYRERINTQRANRSSLARKVRSRSEVRPVLCRVVLHGDQGMVDVIRRDTGEVVQTREMSAREISVFQQGELAFGDDGPEILPDDDEEVGGGTEYFPVS